MERWNRQIGSDTVKSRLKRKKSFFSSDMWQLYAMCAVPLLLVFVFNYIPMGGIIIAFKKYTYSGGIFGSDWCGFDNFEFFFKSKDFLNITWNTLYLNTVFIITGLISAITVGVLLYQLTNRRKTKVFQTMLITPHFISWVVAAYMLYIIINPEFGLMNQYLNSMGKEAVDLYSKPSAWPVILTIASIWKSVGMDSVIYYAALMGISQDLFEAADVDGATVWQKVRYIMLPELKSLIIIMTILKIGGIFRADFGLFYQLTQDVGTLYPTTDVMDTYIFRTMRVQGNMGMSSAAGLLQSFVGFVLVIVTNAIVKKIDSDSSLF